MKIIATKADDTAGINGLLKAEEWNTVYDELKSIPTFIGTPLDGASTTQIAEAMFYMSSVRSLDTSGSTADSYQLGYGIGTEPNVTLKKGMVYTFKAVGDNTKPVQVKLFGNTTSYTIYKDGAALTANALKTGKEYQIIFNGTNFDVSTVGGSGVFNVDDHNVLSFDQNHSTGNDFTGLVYDYTDKVYYLLIEGDVDDPDTTKLLQISDSSLSYNGKPLALIDDLSKFIPYYGVKDNGDVYQIKLTKGTVIGLNAGYNRDDSGSVTIGESAGANGNGKRVTYIGFGAGKVSTSDDNTFIGFESGYSNTTGYSNVFIGNYSGYENTTGYNNVFIGDSVGREMTVGTKNVYVGKDVGPKLVNGHENVLIGEEVAYGIVGGFSQTVMLGCNAGYANEIDGSIFIGYSSGKSNTRGLGNSFIGYNSGFNNTTGGDNTFIGFESGYSTTTGSRNVFIGNYSGYENTTGYNNISIGYKASYSSTSVNSISIGYSAGYRNTSYEGVFIGNYAGFYNDSGDSNTFIGTRSGQYNTIGDHNTFTGNRSGYKNTSGGNNTFYGSHAGYENTTGGGNTFIGLYSGGLTTTGTYNTFIGYNAGSNNTTGHNNIAIGNNSLMPSETSRDTIQLGDPNIASFRCKVALTVTSDLRFKENVTEYIPGLDFINKTNPIMFTFKDDNENKLRLGFSAQEMLELEEENNIINAIVDSRNQEHLAIQETAIIPILVKAVKEQQTQIDELKDLVNKLMEDNNGN